MQSDVNAKKVLIEGTVDAYVSDWGVMIGDQSLNAIIKKAVGCNDGNGPRFVRLRIEWEDLDMAISINGERIDVTEKHITKTDTAA